ncbi:hypothetical protein DPMN_049619 [Dreissena polymorpha]|uniref:Uncharacterized protein n=1 Tax=Dreissena polymorpha TaxID=45954 RepID=A0A9D4CFM9_DREPO|nr:hypothetical protein DPMN_049619 [Dreissena polymorpha]
MGSDSVCRAPTDRAGYLRAVCTGEFNVNTAFAVHLQSGLGISEQSVQVSPL